MSSQWLQTIRPFVPRISPEAVVDSISSPLLGAYNPIPNSVIYEVASRLQMYEKYAPAVGKIAMKRQFLLRFAHTEKDEEKVELIESLYAEYAENMEELMKEEARARKEAEERLSELEKS